MAGLSQLNGRTAENASKQSGHGALAGSGFDIGGFSRPDTSQMVPFKPKLPPAIGYHPTPGGKISFIS